MRPTQPAAAGVFEQLELPFAETITRFLFRVLPWVRWELGQWRSRAAEIPDPVLRRHAQDSLRKRGNIEGAALFATLTPAAHRHQTIRALVAYQSAYDSISTRSLSSPALIPSRTPTNLTGRC